MRGRIYPHVVLLIFANTIFKVSCTGIGSLTFLIDDTSSMGDDIDQVKKSVGKITRIVKHEKSSLIYNMVLVTFNDPGVYDRVVTRDPKEFENALRLIDPHNEAKQSELDCWEPSMKGLLQALSKSKNNSYIFVFTDAPAKDYNASQDVIEMCQKKQTQIVFVLTGRFCNNFPYVPEARNVYFDIAVACSGLAIFVKKQEVEKVFGPIEEIIKGNKTVITTAIVPAGVSKNIPFAIDDHTDYVIASAAGNGVTMKINEPSISVKEIMSTDNAIVVKLSNVKPGNYVATVKGKTKTSVVIVGRTDFFFSHGFSELKPKSLDETSLQPIADANVHLSISVTDDHHTVQIVSALISDMNENPMRNPLPLTEISKDFYVTGLFVAPSQRFKIAVNGIVKATGKPIHRIVKIPITPAEPPKILPTNTKPTVEISEGKGIEIEYNSTVQLTCKVVAFPEPKIVWVNNIGGVVPSKMSLQEFPYKYISYMDISYASKGDRYKCYAANEVGKDETTINVVVKEPFTVISAPSGITKLTYGTEGSITCDVTSRLPMDIHWSYANEMTGQTREIETSDKYVLSASRTQLTIKKMDLDLVGRYACKVSLKYKKDVQKSFFTRVKIDGLIAPKLQGGTEIKVIKGKTAIFECKVVSGLPVPKITWLFGGKSGSSFTPLAGSESVLRITNVEDKHEGKYKCVAENDAGKDDHVTTLFVQDLPKITTKSFVVYQATEGNAVLKIPCVAAGVPKPVIAWKLSGRYITPSAKYSIEDGTLIIRNPKVSDTNSYKCEAKNEVGEVSATFRTNINQEPQVSGVTAMKVRIGTPATIECTVVKGEPEPTITWRFMNNSDSDLPILGSNKVLHISSVENKHAGRYKCVATNKVGSNEHITTLEVQDIPKIVSSVSDIYEGTEGDALLRIPCVAAGLPKPSITWKLDGLVIDPSARYSIENGTLIIRNPKVSDTNSYKCEAKNEVGEVSATFRTNINQEPQVSGVTAMKVRIGTPATIECTVVKGKPEPTITWRFMNNSDSDIPILGSDNVLHISRVENKHAGRYKCVATNKVGSNEHITTLEVQEAPQVAGVATKKVRMDLPTSIECTVVKGEPKPTITWQFVNSSDSEFLPILGADKVLHIARVENKHAGRYKCVATNNIGSDEYVTTLIVESLPEITSNSTTVEGIEGDLALRIPCDVIGVPQPVVTWKINGTKITRDGKYSIEDGALVILKPTKNDSSSYTCEAKNNVGSDSITFQAAVQKYPKTFGTAHYVYVLQGETRKLKCEAYSSESQSVKWFEAKTSPRSPDSSLSTTTSPLELELSETTTVSSEDYYSSTTLPTITLNAGIKEPYIQIVNASYFDDGSYTCRVSDKHGNTHTNTYVVDVGNAPEFLSNANVLSNWRGDIAHIKQNCDIRKKAKPKPVVEWTFNGKVFTDFNSAGIGHYTCNVSNVHGSVQKRFDVKSSECLITRNLGNAHMQYMPLVLNDKGFWHELENTNHYTVVEHDDKITLSCPSQKENSNTFKNFPKKSTLEALCYKEESFVVEDNIYKLSDLQCTNSIQPYVIKKKVKCSTESSELIKVGYNVPGFLEAYEVCFDTETNLPLYTRMIMTETNNNGLSAGYNWSTYPGIGYEKTARGFTCNDTISSCCYSKSQLVNAKDFNDGPAKKSTFIDPLNVVPVWLPCNTLRPTWETINDNVTSLLPTFNEIVTWSGTHTFQEINGTIIPRYLWKVVWYDDTEVIAIVHVNDPSPTEKDIKCKDICNIYSEWIEFNDKYTYCCSLSDFFEAFNIHNINIGESLSAALDEIRKKI